MKNFYVISLVVIWVGGWDKKGVCDLDLDLYGLFLFII